MSTEDCILVTGAAGFIGSRVCELLIESGYSVTGVDNFADTYDPRLKEWRWRKLESIPAFQGVRLDICDRNGLADLFVKFKPNAIINLAARAGVRRSLEDPWAYVDTNVTGTLNLLECCRRYEIPKFVLASSSSIYGDNPPLPTPEDVDTDHPLQPYAVSKKAAELMAYSYHHLYQIDISIFRYFTVYGPGGRPDMAMFRFMQWIAEGKPILMNGDGNQTRGFTYLDDIARGTILGLKPLGYEAINLGGHEIIAMNDLLHKLEDRLGKKAEITYLPRHAADALANCAAVEKARRLLGWEAQVSLDEGLDRMTAWYLQEREWASQLNTH